MFKTKYTVTRLAFPVDGDLWYNAQKWISVDGGKTYYYCGYGHYTRTEAEARQWCQNDQASRQ